MNKLYAGLVGSCLFALASLASAEQSLCRIEKEPVPVDMGKLVVMQAQGAALKSRMSAAATRVGVVCPKDLPYRFRVRAVQAGVAIGEEGDLSNTKGSSLGKTAVMLSTFEGAKVEKRFSALPGGTYAAVGTGAPQWVILKLVPADPNAAKPAGKPSAGPYKAAFRFEVDEG